MQIKKTPCARLESKRPSLFMMGLLMSTAMVLCAFEWRTPIEDTSLSGGSYEEPLPLEDELIPIAYRNEAKVSPPAPPIRKQIIESFVIRNEPKIFNPSIPVFTETEPTIVEIPELKENAKEEPVFDRSEILPSFPGGDSLLFAYLANEIKYPTASREAGIHGRVYVSFVVGKDGQIEQVKIERSLSADIDREALRAVKNMPQWNPGSNNGIPVKVRYYLPVNFKLK